MPIYQPPIRPEYPPMYYFNAIKYYGRTPSVLWHLMFKAPFVMEKKEVYFKGIRKDADNDKGQWVSATHCFKSREDLLRHANQTLRHRDTLIRLLNDLKELDVDPNYKV